MIKKVHATRNTQYSVDVRLRPKGLTRIVNVGVYTAMDRSILVMSSDATVISLLALKKYYVKDGR